MSSAAQRPRRQPVSSKPVRELIEISELDSRLQDEIAEHGSLKLFRITMWRETPDATGCNWNARVDQLKGTESSDSSWWDVVLQMRSRFNLS
jgi:hypothetical protein